MNGIWRGHWQQPASHAGDPTFSCQSNKLAKDRKMRKPPGSLGLKKFGPAKILVKNIQTQTPGSKTPKIEEKKNDNTQN